MTRTIGLTDLISIRGRGTQSKGCQMRRHSSITYLFSAALLLLGGLLEIEGQEKQNAQQIDFISIIKSNPATSKSVGVAKLTDEEQAALNTLMNQVFQLGVQSQARVQNQPPTKEAPSTQAGVATGNPVYITKIDENKDNILVLSNGGIVEVTVGFLGLVGFRKDAVLYKAGNGWRVWVEGKKSFRCNILKHPVVRPSGSGQVTSIVDVKGNGKLLKTADGVFLEVDDINTIETSMWLAPFDALLIDGIQLLNLDDGGELIDVRQVR